MIKTYGDLSVDQRRLFDHVEQEAGYHGLDSRDVLKATFADAADKAAVAEVFGGPGASQEFLDAQPDNS